MSLDPWHLTNSCPLKKHAFELDGITIFYVCVAVLKITIFCRAFDWSYGAIHGRLMHFNPKRVYPIDFF